jgi:hypothetical protein
MVNKQLDVAYGDRGFNFDYSILFQALLAFRCSLFAVRRWDNNKEGVIFFKEKLKAASRKHQADYTHNFNWYSLEEVVRFSWHAARFS